MRLTWHIVKKDIVRDRWALLLWALLFVGQSAMGFFARQYDGIGPELVARLEFANVGLICLQVLMGCVLVARFVQADALIGTNVFWPTRPVSAGRLLAAKVAGVLLLFGLMPILLLLPWWLACDFGWREILWTAVETLGWQLLVIVPAFLLASLTDDLGRLLLWTLLAVIGLFSWIVLLQATFASTFGTEHYRVGPGVMYTKFWLSSAVLLFGGAAIATHQYLTRRFARSVMLIVAGLGVIALIGHVWSLNLGLAIADLNRPALESDSAGFQDGLTFEVESASGMFSRKLNGKTDPDELEASLRIRLRVRGLPEDVTMGVEKVVQSWTWENGLHLTRGGFFGVTGSPDDVVVRRAYSLPPPHADPETIQWLMANREANDARLNANGQHPFGQIPPLHENEAVRLNGSTGVPNSFLAKMRTDSPSYQADLRLILVRPEIVVDLPLGSDARRSSQGQTFRFLRQNDDQALVVTTRASVIKFGLWFSRMISAEFRNWAFSERIVAADHETGDIKWAGDNQTGSKYLQVGGVLVAWNALLITPRKVIRNGQWVVENPNWRKQTTLVFLEDKEIARFSREVKKAKFDVPPEIEETINAAAAGAKPRGKP